MNVILQKSLPFAPWMEAHTLKLPGIQPIKLGDWLQIDDVYTEQLSEKHRILESQFDQVHVLDKECGPAAEELLSLILTLLPDLGFAQVNSKIQRPDGIEISVSPNSSDKFLVDIAGAAGTDDKDIINTKATQARLDFVHLIGMSSVGWHIADVRGTWVDQS